MKKKTILIIIDHDIIFRNFIFNNAFSEIEKKFDVNYLFPEEGNKRFSLDVTNYINKKKIFRVPELVKRKLLWRYLLFLDQCKFPKNNEDRALRKLRFITLGVKASIIFFILSLPIFRQISKTIIKIVLILNRYKALEEFLKVQKPSIVIHPTVLDGLYCNDLTLICKKLKITTIFLMNSWDNPSTKNTVLNNPDYLFVWGKQTKEHAQKFIKMNKNVIEFGANQFDGIKDFRINKIKKKSFEKQKQNILFAGSNAKVDEYNCIRQLDKLIHKNKFSLNCVYRPHPWSGAGLNGYRFYKKKWRNVKIDKYSIKYIKTLKNKNEHIPLPNQRETYESLKSASIIISPLSTIILETILSGRLALAYIPSDNKSAYINQTLKSMSHFKELIGTGIVPILKNPAEIIDMCLECQKFENYRSLVNGQQLLLPKIVKMFDQKWSYRFKKFLESL